VALSIHPHIEEVKERVELDLYCPSRPSWEVIGRTLPLYLNVALYTKPYLPALFLIFLLL
jgi:hypothetical protein